MVTINNKNVRSNVKKDIMHKITGIAHCFQVRHVKSTWYYCQLQVLKLFYYVIYVINNLGRWKTQNKQKTSSHNTPNNGTKLENNAT